MPIAGWNGFNSFRDGKQFSLSHDTGTWQNWICFDIERQHYRVTGEPLGGHPPNGQGMSYQVRMEDGELQDIWHMHLYDHAQQRMARAIDVELPHRAIVRLAASRYVIADLPQEIRWLDIKAPERTWHSLPSARGEAAWSMTHRDLPIMFRIATSPAGSGSTQTPQSYAELFRVDQDQLRLLSSWPCRFNSHINIWFQKDAVASLDRTLTHAELRSLEDGSLIKSLELSPQLDMLEEHISMNDGYLWAEGRFRRRIYSLHHERWLRSPWKPNDIWTNDFVVLSDDGNAALWHNRSKPTAMIVDPRTDRPICTLQNTGERYQFLNASTLVSTDPWLGLTIRQHDLTTGATLMTWRPFWWQLPLLACAVLLSCVWVGMWMRMPKRNANWVWIDLHVLLALALLLIVTRINAVGDVHDISRLPFQHAIYTCSGMLLVAWAWLILGRQPLIVRVSHWLVVYAIVLGALAQTLARESRLAWMGLALASIPSVLALPVLITARVRKWNWFQQWPQAPQSRLVESTRVIGKAEPITIRQILIVTAVFALLSLAVRPITAGIGGMLELRWPIWEAIGITACGLSALALSQSSHPALHRLGTVLASTAVALLIIEALWRATHAGWWQPDWWIAYETPLRHAVGLYSTVFIASYVRRT